MTLRSIVPIVAATAAEPLQQLANQSGAQITDPPLSAALLKPQTLEERLATKEARFQLAREILGDRYQNLNVEGAERRFGQFVTLLSSLEEPHATRLKAAIERISSPSVTDLEENGLFVRRVNQLTKHDSAFAEIERIGKERYWVDCSGNVDFAAFYGIDFNPNQPSTTSRHPGISEASYRPGALPFELSQLNKLMSLLDPDVSRIIDSIPLPPESDQRDSLRAQLEANNAMSFGDSVMVHRSSRQLVGSRLLTQRVLNNLGFSGQLDFGDNPVFGQLQGFHAQGHDWKEPAEFMRALNAGGVLGERLRNAIERAARKNGYHMIGEFFDPGIRDLLGLDNVTCWSYAESPEAAAESDYYGSPIVMARIRSVPDLAVALGDDVTVKATSPVSIARHSRSLVSLRQFQELVLDCGAQAIDGKWDFVERPFMGVFLLDDWRFEIQTRGCMQIIPN